MKNYYINGFLLFLFFPGIMLSSVSVNAQRKFSEGTITYNITINSGDSDPKIADMFDGALSVVYLKGNLSRSEMISSLGVQSTIVNGKTGNITVLKEYGEQKYMIQMNIDEWKDANKKYDSVSFTYEDEFKIIKGYNCQKAIGKLKDGTTFTVFFTKDLKPENKEFQYANKSLPGLALEYESTLGNLKIIYQASQISFDPVPVSKFDIPKSGFRILTYKESKNPGNN